MEWFFRPVNAEERDNRPRLLPFFHRATKPCQRPGPEILDAVLGFHQPLRNLWKRKPFEVAEDDNLPVRFGQFRQGVGEEHDLLAPGNLLTR